MFKISKTFEFDYGHRVWSQVLEEDMSLTSYCKCRHLHGHRGVIGIEFISKELKEGMVTDFNHLNWFKKFVDQTLDHKFLIDINDPNFELITNCNPNTSVMIENKEGRLKTFEIKDDLDPLKREVRSSFVIVNFVPTSENICKWIFDIVEEKLKEKNIKVSKVFFKETPSSYSEYVGE